MGKACCVVVGCTSDSLTTKDIGFFKFPSDKISKQQWRDQLNMKTRRLTSKSQICSQHFDVTDYKVTKGKYRLNKDAVPIRDSTVDNNGDCCSPPPTSKSNCADRLHEDGEKAPSPPAMKYSLRSRKTYNSIIESSSEDSERETSEYSDTESDSEAKLKSRIDDSKDTQPTDKPTNKNTDTTQHEHTNNTDTSITESENPNRDKDIPHSDINVISDPLTVKVVENMLASLDSDGPVDYESLIAQSNLVNNKVINKCMATPELQDCVQESISADKDAPSPDCQMLVENVQVDIDPTTLYMEEDVSNHSADDDIQVIPNAPVEPVSLLTSSDEDEVIIEEPVIPLVEVSDETDEEDMPLNKLHDKNKAKERAEKKLKEKEKEKETKKPLNKIFIKSGVINDLYCYTCGYTTYKRADFNAHMKGHLKPSRVRTIEVCHYCGYSTCSKDTLLRHFRKHRHEKRFQCSLCDYKAKHRMSLIYHMKTHNVESEPEPNTRKRKYECHECSYSTTSGKTLKRHMSKRHKNCDASSGEEYRPGD